MEEGGSGKENGSRAGETPYDSGSSSSSSLSGSSAKRDSSFGPYVSPQLSSGTPLPSNSLRVIVRRPLAARLTKELLETYQICNPNFKYSKALNPKRFLTNPSVGERNNGHDNANSDLILYVNLELVNSDSKPRYVVKDILGQGTFGQVAKCWDLESHSYVAVKVIKNQPAYYQQALVEVSILNTLNQIDPHDNHHIVRILDFFEYQGHLCISFEMLGSNLYELIKMNNFKGLSLSIVQMFSKQILHALVVMKDAGVIHCDLKPENILISTSVKPTGVKVIDFGSACMEGRTIYSYIQSRYYRSPEVLLGYPYSTSIDMWSFGCIVAELFLGLPLFPGASEYDLLKRMIEILGGQPPDYLLRDAKSTSKFFKHVGTVYHLEYDEASNEAASAYRFLSEEEYQVRESKAPEIGKRYFNFVKLEDIIGNYPYRKNLPAEEIFKENSTRNALVDFLRGLVEFDPKKRWSPLQASGHPFVTGEPFSCPYKPPPETARIPVVRTMTVEHNPGGGHWFATGLSPQVAHVNRGPPLNSPHFHRVPMSYGSSYGSLGSHGSYNDNYGLSSSYGSYNDINGLQSHYSPVGPSGFNMYSQVGGFFLGSSPDARHRPQWSHGNGFVLSPASLGPMSLGASPSQFTPPSSQMQMPPAPPGKYGPTSPSRSGIHGLSLGKAAAVGQYNKRRNWGHPTMSLQPYENAAQHGSGHCVDVGNNYSDTQFRGHVGSHPAATSSHYNWRQQTGGNGLSSGFATNRKSFPPPLGQTSNLVSSHTSENLSDIPECSSSLPDPADWDPNYSDESLLQEDNAEVNSVNFEFSNGMRLNYTRDNAIQSSRVGQSSHSQAHLQSSFASTNQGTDGLFQAYPLNETTPSTVHDMHANYGRLPNFSQKFPSRFGQQSLHQYHNMNSVAIHGERNHQYGQGARASSNYNTSDSHSSSNPLFSNSMPWGRKVGLATLPSYHSGKDYGRIS